MSEGAEALREVTSRVLEELCFATVDEAPKSVPASWDVTGRVRFRGHRHGELVIHLADIDLDQLTESMIGDADMVDAQAKLDCVGELANILCGNAITTLFGSDVVCDLAKPVVGADPEGPDSTHTFVRLAMDDGQIFVSLRLDDASGSS